MVVGLAVVVVGLAVVVVGSAVVAVVFAAVVVVAGFVAAVDAAVVVSPRISSIAIYPSQKYGISASFSTLAISSCGAMKLLLYSSL